MKNIIAIDYSVNGTAIFYKKNEFLYFSEFKNDYLLNSNCVPVDKNLPTLERVDNVAKTLIDLIKKMLYNKIDLLVLESPAYNASNRSDEFKDGYAIIKYIARLYKIPYILVPPISAKLYFTGDSKAEKIDMHEQCFNEFGTNYKQYSSKKWDNIVDAKCFYSIGVDYLNCKEDINNFCGLPLHRQQVIAKLLGNEALYKNIVKKRNKLKK